MKTLDQANSSGDLIENPQIGSTDAADKVLKQSEIEAILPSEVSGSDLIDNDTWVERFSWKTTV